LEVHFYHLWERDCGLTGHELDAEHVSVLLVADRLGSPASRWRAAYWYAAGHEDTLCDSSNAARAAAIGAEHCGATVWIAADKHASYLMAELCGQRGCVADRCEWVAELPPGQLVNLGERGAPLAGALWVESRDWPLASKMGSDFDPVMLARLDAADAAVVARVNHNWRPVQVGVSVGGDAVGALVIADRHAGRAVSGAEQKTGAAVWKGLSAVGRALRQTGQVLTDDPAAPSESVDQPKQ
jgi:hypothetical protein